MEFVSIPAGAFQMGSTAAEVDACVAYWGGRLVNPSYDLESFRRWIMKEFPRHRRRMSAFRIGRFPVTNGEYQSFQRATGAPAPESLLREEPADHPVWGVSFADARAYAGWLGERLGERCRLPSEAEWEYAARGTTGREYPWGDTFDAARCNTIEAGIGSTTPVGRYAEGVSAFGVYDLAGNVEEWTADCYAPYPGGTFIEDNITEYQGPRYHVLRGGCFALGGDLARCARRHGPAPGAPFRYRGFRIAIDGPG